MITLEQLSIYLPYTLKGVLTCSHEDDFYNQDWADLSKFQQGCIWQLAGYTDPDLNVPLGEGEYTGLLWRNETTYVCFHSGIKPLLRPLSKLTEVIEDGGIKITPIEELGNYAYNNLLTSPDIEIIKKNIEDCEYWIIKKLASWHFDLYSLIEQGLAEEIK